MEDLIDFPVSDDWLDFYHERGLTPRSSGRYSPAERRLLEEIENLRADFIRLAEQQSKIVQMIYELMKQLNNKPQPKVQEEKRYCGSLLMEVSGD